MKDYRAHLVITVAEAAEWLRTSEEAVIKLADDGRIPAVRYTPEDPPVFRPEDIVAFVEGQSGSAQPSGLFGPGPHYRPVRPRRGRVFAPPTPPTPPTPPRPPKPPAPRGFAFASVHPDDGDFEHSYEYSFTHSDEFPDSDDLPDADELRAQADVLRSAVDELRQQQQLLKEDTTALRDELTRRQEEQDR